MSGYEVKYALKEWDEETRFERQDGSKCTIVKAAFEYGGGIVGRTSLAYVMRYGPDGRGVYEGYERLEAEIAGLRGEAILRHEGAFDEAGVDARVESVAGSGTGCLAGRTLRFASRFEGHGPYPISVEIA